MLGRLRAGDARTQRSLRAARPRQRDTRGLPAAHPAATSRRGSAGSACASRCPPSSCACGADGVRGAPGMGRSGAATARGPPAVLHADGRTDGALQITHPSLQAETPLQVSPDGRPSISFLLASPLQPALRGAVRFGSARPRRGSARLGSAERRQRRRLLSASRRAEPAAGPARAGGGRGAAPRVSERCGKAVRSRFVGTPAAP